ncbi:hypothetical protein Tco_1122783, partial [Tanacetum coccineum]
MGSELCLQVFVVENATCLLTIPPYLGGIFKRVGGPPKEELPPEPGKDGSWVSRRYERLSVTREMRTVRKDIPILYERLGMGGVGTDIDKKTKIKTKTEHGNRKNVKSQSQKVKVKDEAETEEILNGPTRTYLIGR